MAGLTWVTMDFYYTRKWSAVSLCSGILAGLVGLVSAPIPSLDLDDKQSHFYSAY